MKIAGIYPLKVAFDPKVQHAVSEPYGLEMILAVAQSEGHEVELFIPAKEVDGSLIGINEREFIDKIAAFKPDVAAFSLYTCQYPFGKRIAKELKKINPNITTVAGNRFPTHLGKRLDEPFDFFVIKEGEETFRALLAALSNGKCFEDVKGIVFRRNKEAVFTGVRERILDLDSLPAALRFPMILNQAYKGISIPTLSTNPRYAIMEYSRCCYNNCKFCDNGGFWGNRVVFRSPERVVDEMIDLKQRGVDIFYFMDLNFTAVPKKTEELCKCMIERGLNASWYCMSNTSTLDGRWDLLKLMKEAGCFKIAYGVESTNDHALEKMNKKVGSEFATNAQTKRVLQMSMEAGMLNQGFYIIGFPWETGASILKDSKLLKDLAIHQLNIGIFTPIPLSRFYDSMLAKGYRLNPNLEKHDRNTLVYNHKTLDNASLKVLQDRIYKAFYRTKEYRGYVETLCNVEPRFRQAFDEYFAFTSKEIGLCANGKAS